MTIEAKGFTIEMTYNELWATAWDIKYHLKETIKTHWVNHQENWIKNESERLERMKAMFNSLGRADLYEDVFVYAKDVFSEFNSKS